MSGRTQNVRAPRTIGDVTCAVREGAGYPARMTNPAPIRDVPIGGDGIRLGQFLKFAGILDSGGDSKEAIIDGFVKVNGEVDRRRGRQLRIGDLVTFEGRTVRVSA
jgi:ribosome-associated protein